MSERESVRSEPFKVFYPPDPALRRSLAVVWPILQIKDLTCLKLLEKYESHKLTCQESTALLLRHLFDTPVNELEISSNSKTAHADPKFVWVTHSICRWCWRETIPRLQFAKHEWLAWHDYLACEYRLASMAGRDESWGCSDGDWWITNK